MILDKKIISDYNNSRSGTNKGIICHAPFVNLNFEQNGNIRACCYNTTHILGKWPQNSIAEIWSGEKANELRNYIQQNDLGGGCSECGRMIEAGNHQGVRAKFYDEFSTGFLENLKQKFTGKINFPRVMEFELSNECNLECVMCNGYFSSSIRKNREKLPPIHSSYNEKFVDELEPFLPHMTDAKFLGGEPFMIDIYLSIWERIRKINPNIRIHITTNGTFLNNRVKELLEGLRAGIILSIDSVNRETYSKIRVNGNFDKVMENLEYFRDYTKRKNTFISIAACPIIYNWKELPQMLEFCLEKNIALYFNAVFTPLELSLREQTIGLQTEVLVHLESYPLPEIKGAATLPRNLSIKAFHDFVMQLRGWLEERKEILMEKEEKIAHIQASSENYIAVDANVEWSADKISKILLDITAIEGKGLFDEEKNLKSLLAGLLLATPTGKLKESFTCYVQLYEQLDATHSSAEIENRIISFSAFIEGHSKKNQVLGHLATLSPMFFARWVCETDGEQMKALLEQFFSAM